MLRRLMGAIMLCSLWLAVCSTSHADSSATTVFGPTRFERGHGEPTTETITFSSQQVRPNSLVKIECGDAQDDRGPASGSVILNGSGILGPSDFKHGVSYIERRASLGTTNELAVRLTSTPGSFIVITIFGDPDTPPTPPPDVVFSADPTTIEAGRSTTLNWTSTHASSCGIDQGIGNLPLMGSLSVSPTQTTTYTLTVQGAGGTTAKSVTVQVTSPRPSVSLAVSPETIQTGQSAVLTWSSSHAEGCTIEPGIGAVSPDGTATVAPGVTTTYTITATGPGGTEAATATVKVTSAVSIDIIRPSGGENLSKRAILVEGTISNPSESPIGVTVNGVPAIVYEDRFVAGHVPLLEGQNTITAAAVDMAGNVKEDSLVVFAEPPEEDITLTPTLAAGLSPFETVLVVHGPVSSSQAPTIEDSGPGPVLITANGSPERMTATMEAQGIYYLTASITDSMGTVHTDTVALAVVDRDRMDAHFRSLWSGMLTCLRDRNIQGALGYFTDVSRDKYGRLFNTLRDRLPEVASKLADIEMVYVEDQVAQYRLRKNEAVQGQTRSIAYCIYFVKDASGLWKISEF